MRVAPELPVDHIERDIDLCTRLIKEVFEYDKGIEFPEQKITTEFQTSESKEAHLDTLLLYLRKIHGFCFYSGIKCEDERVLTAKCGP